MPKKRRRQICAEVKTLGALVKTLHFVAQGWLWLTVLLMPILALAGGLGFQAAGGLMGLSALLAWSADRSGAAYLRAAWPLWLLGFLLWAWMSSLWSSYDAAFFGGSASLLMGLVIPVIFVPFLVLKMPDRLKPAFIWAVIGAGLLGVVLLLIDSASGFALSLWGDPVAPGGDPRQRLSDAEMNVGRGQVSYAQLLWPVATLLILRLKRGWILALVAVFGLMMSSYLNDLAIVIPTLLLAASFAGFAWWRPKLGLMLAFGLAIASVVFAPALGVLSSLADVDLMRKIPLSWEHRLRMWAYSWELIQQAPLIGHGFDSSRVFDELTFLAPDGRNITIMSMHPHNIGLHIWLETGVVGVLLAVGLLLALLKIALKICTQSARAFAVTGLVVTIATSGAATVGVWQHWWWALIVLAVSLICLVPEKAVNTGEPKMSII